MAHSTAIKLVLLIIHYIEKILQMKEAVERVSFESIDIQPTNMECGNREHAVTDLPSRSSYDYVAIVNDREKGLRRDINVNVTFQTMQRYQTSVMQFLNANCHRGVK